MFVNEEYIFFEVFKIVFKFIILVYRVMSIVVYEFLIYRVLFILYI